MAQSTSYSCIGANVRTVSIVGALGSFVILLVPQVPFPPECTAPLRSKNCKAPAGLAVLILTKRVFVCGGGAVPKPVLRALMRYLYCAHNLGGRGHMIVVVAKRSHSNKPIVLPPLLL